MRRTLPVGSHPRACVWDAADPRWLYVAVEDDAVVAVVDRTLGEVASTIPVHRLPSGLAASAAQAQIYVTHRIDGDVTYIDTGTRSVVVDVALADEPYSAPTVPNGKPFGFESLTLTANGRRAWVPHELLAPTHPIVFNRTIFPAISVVDLYLDTEVQSDPNSANVDGRKNLFDAINLVGPDGQPEVFSQLCSVAMHPNGFIAWGLACGSEDLLVFDVNQGIATDVVRNVPGDHPVGLTLDDTGQRIFVLSDQSHTLATFDTDGGNLVGETRPYGAPISTVGQRPGRPGAARRPHALLPCQPGEGDALDDQGRLDVLRGLPPRRLRVVQPAPVRGPPAGRPLHRRADRARRPRRLLSRPPRPP